MKKPLPTPIGTEQITFKGKLIEIVEQKWGVGDKQFTMEYARRAPGTRLVIISPDKKILLTEEYRVDLLDWDIRLPGGKVVDSLQEYEETLKNKEDMLNKALIAAKKEALEEVGLEVLEIKHFLTAHCGVTMIWDLYYFIVTKYSQHPDGQKLELGENIKLNWVSFDEAKRLCLNGSIQEDRTVAILLRFLSQVY